MATLFSFISISQHLCLLCCNSESTFFAVEQDCQLDMECGEEIPTLLIRINKVGTQIYSALQKHQGG